jgi:hypothetical protein
MIGKSFEDRKRMMEEINLYLFIFNFVSVDSCLCVSSDN